MKKISLVSYFLFIAVFVAKAQIPFSQISQAPLLISPSFAGAKNNARVNAVSNYGNSPQLSTNNTYLSADFLSKKLYSGIGIYYLRTNNIDKSLNAEVYKDIGNVLSSKHLSQNTQNAIGLCIAPKLNSPSHNVVISPSLFTEFGFGNRYAFVGNRYLYSNSYSSDFPNGISTKESLNFYTSEYKLNDTKLGLGFLVNTTNFYVAVKSYFAMGKAHENLFANNYSFDNQQVIGNSIQTIENLYRMNNMITIAYNFNSADEFSVTPIIGIGHVKYLNPSIKTENNNEAIYYYSQFLEQAHNGINYLHFSLTARKNAIYFGYSHTQNEDILYNGIVIGLQKENFKLSSSLMATRRTFLGELAFSYWF